MIVLDTNAVSELMRDSPTQVVANWWRTQVLTDLFTTTVVEAELRYGAARLSPSRRRNRLFQAIHLMLANYFPSRILAYDRAAPREYAEIMAHRQAIGRSLEHQRLDCQIAAIARANSASVATRNVRHFTDCGIEVINPWEAAATQ